MEFTLNAVSGQIQVALSASVQGRDGVFWLYGGEKRHIGAVALRECGGAGLLYSFPGHREDGIVGELARRLERDGRLEHIVVCGGIHYDNINPEWIPKIVALCSQLGERLVRELKQRLEVQEGDTSWNVPG